MIRRCFPRPFRWAAAALLLAAAAAAQDAPKVAGTDVPPPKRTKFVSPEYPPQAQAQGIRGIVILELLIDEQGKVASVDVIRSIAGLDEAAISAVRKWEFEQTKVDGKPVRVRHTVPITFALKLPEMTRQQGIPELRQGAVPAFPQGASESPASVTAEVTLDAQGNVSEAQVKTGESPFAEALIQALRTWRFQPPGEGAVISFRVKADFTPPAKGAPGRVALDLSGLQRSESMVRSEPEPAPAVADPTAPTAPEAATPPAATPPAASPPTAGAPPTAPPSGANPEAPRSVPGAPRSVPGAPPSSGPGTPPPAGEKSPPSREPPSGAAPAAGEPGKPPAASEPGQPEPEPATPKKPAPPETAQRPPDQQPKAPAAGTGTPPAAGAASPPATGTTSPPAAMPPPSAAPAGGKPAPPPVEVIRGPAPSPSPAPRPVEPGMSAVRDVTLGVGVPDLMKGRRPVVPPLARMGAVGGRVEVRFAVDAAGNATVTKVEGPDLLKEAAQQTVASWSFRRTSAERLRMVADLTYAGDNAVAAVHLEEAQP
jgi:TonB family protein